MTSPDEASSIEGANASSPDQPARTVASRRRSFLPRFGLRTLLILGVLFCLLFGWVGRNLVQMRREDAAIETLKQAGATIYIGSGKDQEHHPATPYLNQEPDWNRVPSFASRLVGWSGGAPVRHVSLSSTKAEPKQLYRALATLTLFPKLDTVQLYGRGVTDGTLKDFPDLPGVKTLALAETSVTAQGLANLPEPAFPRALALPAAASRRCDRGDALSPRTAVGATGRHARLAPGDGSDRDAPETAKASADRHSPVGARRVRFARGGEGPA